MTPDERDRLAKLEERVANLHSDVATLHIDMKEMVAEQRKTNRFLSEIQGGRKAMWKVLSFAAAIGAVLTWLIDKWMGPP